MCTELGLSCYFLSVVSQPGCYTSSLVEMLRGPGSLGRGSQLLALASLGPVLASASCNLGASALSCHPCPSATSPLSLSHHMAWWTFLWAPQLLGGPVSSRGRDDGVCPMSLELCLKAKDGVPALSPFFSLYS